MNTPDPISGYAYWIAPDGSSRVTYSLAVFHEIDGVVNESYRRIPHGGVETGGLLFGTRNNGAPRIEAFRPIECQHAFGPSFVLSDGDLSRLREQLHEAGRDPELSTLQPLGWFLGHTRSPLVLNERELQWFNELFPEPGSATVLVKPERFQPTQFGFLLRDQAGTMPQDARPNAIILPLSQSGSTASIPAPKPPPVAVKPVPAATYEEPVRSVISEPPVRSAISTPPEPLPAPPVPAPPAPAAAPEYRSSPEYRIAPRRQLAIEQPRTFLGLSGASIAVLILAAILGCLAGYWAYLQLPSPVIPVSVREQQGQLIVEWPATQTRNVDYAALQVDNGQWTVLSDTQKVAGRAAVTAPPGDVQIELVAKHWLRDSRGIVRYIRAPKA